LVPAVWAVCAWLARIPGNVSGTAFPRIGHFCAPELPTATEHRRRKRPHRPVAASARGWNPHITNHADSFARPDAVPPLAGSPHRHARPEDFGRPGDFREKEKPRRAFRRGRGGGDPSGFLGISRFA
jgi:hypothetical protein